MYDHKKQYRCTIIRGKSKKEMDDLLPAYALVIDQVCPCTHKEFEHLFDNAFQKFLPESERIKKTLDNHRTEISGKLFGMYFFSENGMVYESERTKKYLEDSDQPAFFKDICFKMQFPNGMQKVATTVKTRVADGICVRPFAFILKLLQIARVANIHITKKAIGYYVLNALDVLQGNANPCEVLEVIARDQKDGIERDIKVPGKASSYKYQHINEQLNYLELANLIRITDDRRVILNVEEMQTIDLFTEQYNQKPEFDVYTYDLSQLEGRKKFQYDWDNYYSRLSEYASKFSTKAESLSFRDEDSKDVQQGLKKSIKNLTEFGDEGEALVYEYEKKRVSAYSTRLANKVLSLGKTRGLGYDIQSVIAEPGDMDEFVKYIEVKSTKRYTCPDPNDKMWVDTLNITRNEFIAAQQHGAFYAIYRVYFTSKGVTMFIMDNVAQKLSDGRMKATPMTYRLDFHNDSVDNTVVLTTVKGEENNV